MGADHRATAFNAAWQGEQKVVSRQDRPTLSYEPSTQAPTREAALTLLLVRKLQRR